MNHFFTQVGIQKSKTFFMLLFFMLLSNSTIFAQTSVSDATSKTENNEMVNNTVEINTINPDTNSSNNMNFVLWFMGSKQDPNVKISPAGENTRRQFITSGLAPNRLLIKAFLKKAVNFEIATS
ncbi:hypothetical protein [Flavobacterium eburneipallidum]|uniref:hypothetical protein n=1 Tax=Flavobacterium eburneipallidum TaxID=3003263 RepID=UPI0022ABF251|nr:hypothetical protein [Flavobacterium eburneipallidum]